ncbi:PepSY domain-containing protein [Rhodovarius crocodyli]|nr:PepSY domain-containing protein [Rhodovarius crocodyli]
MLYLALSLLLALTATAHAGEGRHGRRLSHDRARAAVAEGRILPLADIMARLRPGLEARVIEVELEEHHGALVYEMRAVTPEGRLLDIEVDAATGRLLRGGE